MVCSSKDLALTNSFGLAFPEHQAHSHPQVLRILDEAEAHVRLVTRPEVFLTHLDDRCGLPNRPHVHWSGKKFDR